MSRRASKVCYWQDAPSPRDQIVLFVETLEERIPADHPVRILDEILDQMDWADWESEYHQRRGQPPIQPSVMCKVLLFAMIRRIRSSRQMEYNLRHSIDFIWLASGRTIDHSTLSEFRRQHPQQLKALYRQMVQLAINLGVAKLAEVCIDGTRVLANARRFKTLTASQVERLLAELDQQIAEAMSEWDTNDQLDDLFDDGQTADQLPSELRDMKARQEKLQAALAQLQEMDLRRKYKGRDPQENPAQFPSMDGDSRILPNKEGGYAPNYTPMAMTEMENGFIVGADVLIGNVEHTMLTVMLDQVEADYGENPQTALADSIFATGQNLTAMEDCGQEFLSPPLNEVVADNPAHRENLTQAVSEKDLDQLPKNPETKRFDKQAFVYDAETDCYYCPAGKALPRAGTEKVERSGETVELTVFVCPDCAGCAFAARCRTNVAAKRGHKVTRDGQKRTGRKGQAFFGRDGHPSREATACNSHGRESVGHATPDRPRVATRRQVSHGQDRMGRRWGGTGIPDWALVRFEVGPGGEFWGVGHRLPSLRDSGPLGVERPPWVRTHQQG